MRCNGDHIIHFTYGQYSGRYKEAQIGQNSFVGNLAYLPTFYAGPAGRGIDFAPGLNIENDTVSPDLVGTPEVALANVFQDEDLKSPLTPEFTTSYGATLGGDRAYAEASYLSPNDEHGRELHDDRRRHLHRYPRGP